MTKSPPLVANIFTDPVGWGGTMVGTRFRYLFTLVFLPFFVLVVLDKIAVTGICDYWSSALLIVAYHLMFVHSLRALYKKCKTGRMGGIGVPGGLSKTILIIVEL
ncbi:MAG: hypothetical protein ISR87_08145 [Candidatus Marinimicrobia bacterium]|nr:hypothetical protein [FCB group bacterium]MBL7025414.1 hypothetical protein [Candidatus Neomarinimicrobiota bacterium]